MSPSAETEHLGQRAYQLACELVERFGPRPAGSASEAQARAWAASQLTNWGYQVETQSVKFPSQPRVSWTLVTAGASLVLCALLFAFYPFLGLVPPVVLFFLPSWLRWEVRRRACSEASENLTACLPGDGTPKRLLVVAHLDSAPARRLSGWVLHLYSRSLDIAQRTAIAMTAAGALSLAGFVLPKFVVILLGLASATAGAWLVGAEVWNVTSRPVRFSPGANDNASGVGLLLALAEHCAAHSAQQLNLSFLITTAEETGMQGAWSFALTGGQKAAPVLCLDTIGSGAVLRYVVRDGSWRPLVLSKKLNSLLAQGMPGSKPLWYIEKSGDHAPFVRQGYETSAIQVTGSPLADLRYHTIDDTASGLEAPAFGLAAEAALFLIEKLAIS